LIGLREEFSLLQEMHTLRQWICGSRLLVRKLAEANFLLRLNQFGFLGICPITYHVRGNIVYLPPKHDLLVEFLPATDFLLEKLTRNHDVTRIKSIGGCAQVICSYQAVKTPS
jgi:hypothetical protein